MRSGTSRAHVQLSFTRANGEPGFGSPGLRDELSFGVDHRDPRLLARLAEIRGDLGGFANRARLWNRVPRGPAKDHVGSRNTHDVEPEVVGIRQAVGNAVVV